MNKQTITFTASEQTLTKTGGIEHYASNIVSYIEASFTLGDNWAGYDSIRAVWKSGYARIATVLDANNKCIVPTEVLTYKSKVNVNLVGSIVENTVLTDRLTTYPILALTVDADARVDSSETTPVTASQFEQFVDVVRDEASAIQNYTYDSEAWAVGQRAGVDVPSTDETYQNNAKYYADQGATLQQEVTDLKSDINHVDDNMISAFASGNIMFNPTSFRGGSVNLLTGVVDFLNPPTTAIIDSNATLIKLYSNSVRLKIESGMQVRMVIYNPDKTYNTFVNWNTTADGYPSALQNKKGYYVRIFGSYRDNRQLTQEDFNALTSVYSVECENISTYVDKEIANYGELQPIGNILNPLDFLVRGYYLNFDDGVTHVSTSSTARISSRIYTGLISGVCLRQQYNNDSTATIAIYCYDDNDNYLGYSYVRFNAIKGNSFALELKKGTTSIVVYSGALDSGASHLCVSLYELDAFTLYSEKYAIKENTLPNNKLTGKVIVNFGDSIFGNHRPASDISTQIALKGKATVYNLGFGGCRMSATNDNWSPFSMQALAESIASNDYTAQDNVDVGSVSGMPSYFVNTRALLESIDFNTVDIATISYGTNDFTDGATLDNEANPLDRSTICGALRYSIETLLTAFPQMRIFVLTPTYRFWLNGTTFVEDSSTKVINGIKLTDIIDKYIEIAKDYNLPLIDNYYELGVNKFNRSRFYPSNDGTHQNNNGVVLIADHILNELF